ncbi:hypothetical protein E2C01_090607 [Portunus trituberculatus]|uniref:Uncharacterized protein n=1 Tax=Portunus trituberculatus TaxID=210409 RepID=A0A5B7JQT9_PORTR|nr:hypothetical protein [Portunus trituberculatus]
MEDNQAIQTVIFSSRRPLLPSPPGCSGVMGVVEVAALARHDPASVTGTETLRRPQPVQCTGREREVAGREARHSDGKLRYVMSPKGITSRRR